MNVLTWKSVCRNLQNTLPPEIMKKLTSNFKIAQVSGKRVTIGYFDEKIYTEITSYYNREIVNAINEELGAEASLRFKKVSPTDDDISSMSPEEKKKAKKHKYNIGTILCTLVCVLICFAVIAVTFNFIQNLSFKETFYTMSCPQIHDNLRIIQLSDLHNTSYGANNKKLINRIKALCPDIIVLTGDIIDSAGSADAILDLCLSLSGIAPCYYIYGNNEKDIALTAGNLTLEALAEKFGFTGDDCDPQALYESDNGLRAKLEATGVKVLFDESDRITVGNTTIDIFGTLSSNPSSFWPYAGTEFQAYLDDTADFKLFLSHEPTLFEEFNEQAWGDLALSGHTHGGIVRLPNIGGIYAPGEKLFPELSGAYVYGKYKLDDTQLIVSGGLTNGDVFRFNNQPELVIVDVSKY